MVDTTPLVYDKLNALGGLSDSHRAVIEAVPPNSKVLDVGCASGYVAEVLQRDKGCAVTGLDYSQEAVNEARRRGIEAEQIDLNTETLSADGYDAVIFPDVLEHLMDPEGVLRSVREAPLVVVSLPNIAHWTARRELLTGNWPRDDYGLFDRTHVHYFNRDRMYELAEAVGRTVVHEAHTTWPLPLETRLHLPKKWRRVAADRWPTLFSLQFVLTLR